MFLEFSVLVTGVTIGLVTALFTIIPVIFVSILSVRYAFGVSRAAAKDSEEWRVAATNAIIRSHIENKAEMDDDEEDDDSTEFPDRG